MLPKDLLADLCKTANELINDPVYDQIDDLNNSNLYIVNLCDSSISHRLIKVN